MRTINVRTAIDAPRRHTSPNGGPSEELVQRLSAEKGEPKWMTEHRSRSLKIFQQKHLPVCGPDLSGLPLDDITYYTDPGIPETDDWGAIPPHVRRIYERLGIPEAERKVLAGVGAQYESEVIYHRLKEEWQKQGVIFLNLDDALRQYPDLVQKYFMQCVPATDHLFVALHGAVWSGGTFLYVPAGVTVTEPLQAYFRMNARAMGQFEHTLIVVEEGAKVQYIEGCSAPKYGKYRLHAGCVEIFVKAGAHMRYSSVENWSRDTFNLNTKRALVDREGTIEWVGGNLGSGVTMLYPCSVLRGEGARADHLGLAFAGRGQWQDTGAKVFHLAPHTSSTVVSKSLSKSGGRTVYRGMLNIAPQATDSVASISCDALLLDEKSSTETIPSLNVQTDRATVAHEAKVGKLSADDIFYVMSRGLSEEEAKAMIVNGFLEPIIRKLPLEYAVEMNRLIELEMEGSVG